MKDSDVPKNRRLWERPPPEGYVEEMTAIFRKEAQEEDTGRKEPYFIFRLCQHRFGISPKVVKEAVILKPIHSIPHNTNEILRGVVNIEGRLTPVISLEKILGLKDREEYSLGKMVVFCIGQNEWVAEVAEIEGIYPIDSEHLQNIPVTLLKSPNHYLKGIAVIQGENTAILDEELLFYSLTRGVK